MHLLAIKNVLEKKNNGEEAKVECSTPCLGFAAQLSPARHKKVATRSWFNSFNMKKAILGINHWASSLLNIYHSDLASEIYSISP